MNGLPEPLLTPLLATDIIIEMDGGAIVLIERATPPAGWALPGGFVDRGESCEAAAVREALEETGLHVELLRQLGVWSHPQRDPRGHTASVVFVARPTQSNVQPVGASDAKLARCFARSDIPWDSLAFDHADILRAYLDGVGPTDSLVGHQPLPPVDESEAAALLAHARRALLRFVRDGEFVTARLDASRLRVRQGLFVSVFQGGRLRGCAGRAQLDLPLDEATVEMALLAAVAESRIAPLLEQDLGALELVIDLLGPLIPLRSAAELQVGEHGALVELNGRRGVLLPRVASQFGWNAERFLRATSEKAGLEPDGWLHPEARVCIFSTQTLHEQNR